MGIAMQMKSMFSGDTNKDELHCRSGPGPLISVNADFQRIIRYFLTRRRGRDKEAGSRLGVVGRSVGRSVGRAGRPRARERRRRGCASEA